MTYFYSLPSDIILEIYKYIPNEEINAFISPEWNNKLSHAFKSRLQTSPLNWFWFYRKYNSDSSASIDSYPNPIEWNDNINNGFKFKLNEAKINWISVWQDYKNLDLIYNHKTVLDLRDKLDCWSLRDNPGTLKYIINKNKDVLNQIEVLVIKRQIDLATTIIDLKRFIEMLPKLKYLDFCTTFCNGGNTESKNEMIYLLKLLIGRNIKVKVNYNFIRCVPHIPDIIKNALITSSNRLKIEPCPKCKCDKYGWRTESRCEACNEIMSYVTKINEIRWSDEKFENLAVAIDDLTNDLNRIAEQVPDHIIYSFYNYFSKNEYLDIPINIDRNKITLEIVRQAVIKLLKDFRITNDNSIYDEYPNILCEGIIFLFWTEMWDDDDYNHHKYGGWNTIFHNRFNYPEIHCLLRYIVELL